MLTTEIMDLVNELEENFPVDQWVVDGIHVWPLIRMDFSYRLIFHFNFPVNPYNGSNKLNHLRKYGSYAVQKAKPLLKYFYSYCKDFTKNDFLKTQADLLFRNDGATYCLLNEKFYDKFCDPLIEQFKYFKINGHMLTADSKFNIPRYTPSKFIHPHLELTKVKRKILSRRLKLISVCMNDLDKMVAFLHKKNIPLEIMTLNEILVHVYLLRLQESFFRMILEHVKPLITFQICYYSITGWAFNLASRDYGIPCVDIQHGRQGPLHPAYGRWRKVPATGYELLPSIFWNWDNDDKDTINSWNQDVTQFHKPLVGGYLFENKWLSPAKDELVDMYDKQIHQIKNNQNEFIHVLYTLSGYEEIQYLDRIFTMFADWKGKVFIWARTHPCFMHQKKQLHQLLKEKGILNINTEQASCFPLFALLRHMDVHITGCSSTVIEAENFGIPSVVIDAYGKEFFQEQQKSGIAISINSFEELISAIELQYRKKSIFRKRIRETDKGNEALEYILNYINQNKH